MVTVALLARIEAKPGKEKEVEAMLKGALEMANAESRTPLWFGLKMSSSSFGIFDAFANEADRDAHLNGSIAAALMEKASELLARPPQIEKVEVLAAKMPG